ncbi:arabinose operon transcriptional regulator AraC [Haliea sp. E17]|uniref:arabinose operon transcriptional regulator AraC n=1 Tax=Haliea sp. E17 TaxID=3401576 RepID=UPI003AAB9028
MAKTSDTSPVRLAAGSLYRWYLDRETTEQAAARLHRWLSSGAGDNPLTAVDIDLLLARVRADASFSQRRSSLLARWKDAMAACGGRPDGELARQFLHAWLEEQDHGLLFNQSLLAGVTRAVAGELGDITTFLYDRRSFWTLHLTLQGGATYTSDCELEVSAGNLVLIAPDARCHYQRAADCDEWVHAWVIFQPREDWLEWLQWPSPTAGLHACPLDDTALFTLTEQLMADIRAASQEGGRFSAALGTNLLEQLLLRVATVHLADLGYQGDPRVGRACDILRERLDDPPTVEAVARHCHLSPSRMAHLFKQEMGISMQQFRIRLQMQLARELLVTTRMPVERIAMQAGYGDRARFSRAFRKFNGCSPRRFRQQYIPPGETLRNGTNRIRRQA